MPTLANAVILPSTASGAVTGLIFYTDAGDEYGAGDSDDGSGSAGIGAGETDMSNWYAWTCPTSGYYRFDTRVSSTAVHTSMTAWYITSGPHTPVQQSDLTQEPYISSGNEPVAYGYEVGALIAFYAAAGSVIYINITSRFSETGAYGLEWHPFSFTTLGACGSCTPANTGLCLIGSAGMGDMNVNTPTPEGQLRAQGNVSYGSPAAGFYYALYCGGAFYSDIFGFWYLGDGSPEGPTLVYSMGAGTYYGIFNGSGALTPASSLSFTAGQIVNGTDAFYVCIANVTYLAGHTWTEPRGDTAHWSPITTVAGFGGVVTGANQQAAEIAGACISKSFCHSGGNIVLSWWQDDPGDFINGTPNPAFALFLFAPSQQLVLSIQSIGNTGASGSGYTYSVTVKIQNTNLRFASGPFSLVLNNADDVSSSSGTVNVSSIAANSSTTATFTFYSASTNSLTGQFQLLNCNGGTDGAAQTFLMAQAVIGVSFFARTACVGTCTSLCDYMITVPINNSSVMPLSGVTVGVTAPAIHFAPLFFEPAGTGGELPTICAETFSLSSVSGTSFVVPPGEMIYLFFGVVRASSSAPTTQLVTITSSVGAINFPNFTENLTLA